MERIFIDWRRPALAATAEWLFARNRSGNVVDLSGVIVAVPGGRAGRRLLELLVEQTDAQALTLVPPQILTGGNLPEQLYAAKLPFADLLTQQLAWISALQATDAAKLARVIPQLPEQDDLFAWLALAEMLTQLHQELAAELLDFADVHARGPQLATFREEERWKVLADVQARYLKTLDDLRVWDLQTARRVAVRDRECHTACDIVLAGIVELNGAQRAMLEQVAGRVTALVFAPENLTERFDEFGCLQSAAWESAAIDFPIDRVEIAGGPGDQADAVLRAVAALGGKYAAEDIAVGVPDERLVPFLQQGFAENAVAARYGVGVPITNTSPYRLLDAMADLLQTQRFATLAALLRHPALGDWLKSRDIAGDWLTALDRFQGEHLPSRAETPGGLLRVVQNAVQELLDPFQGKAQPLGQWCAAVLNVLVTVYGARELDRNVEADRVIIAACDAIANIALAQSRLPKQLAPRVAGAEALRLILREVAGESIPPRAETAAIELLGWLELRLDDAPVTIVAGFNEGFVPSSRNGDLFLPNELRRQLGLEDNDHRYARDAYALAALAASREELRLIVGRRTADNDPLVPSRLLFACDPAELPTRVLRFFGDDAATTRVLLPGSLKPGQEKADFPVPEPRPLPEPVTSMRVTEFKEYLACPYRYYLKCRLNLESLADAANELDGGSFGSLLHEVFKSFGTGPSAASTDPDVIRRELSATLDKLVADTFGKSPLPAVSIQIEQVRQRLDKFSDWQADWCRQGWRIRYVEQVIEANKAPFDVDDKPMFLRGRIDRVDVNEHDGRWVVFDYKTGDKGETPEKTHREKDGTWIDLQLPLYRHVVRALELDGPVELGYILLPRDVSKTGGVIAEWTADDLTRADDTARKIIRNIRDQKFWPKVHSPPKYAEDLSAICQDQRFEDEEENEP